MKDEPTELMKRRKHILLITAALLLVVPLALLLRKPQPLDLSKDEEPFRSMALPPKSVTGYRIEDGETIGMAMTDRAGNKYLISFSKDYCLVKFKLLDRVI